ncbi:MAG TPA: MBL fold metallo-hydrolase [Opitutaceae bacterium]|nr:MBL fold metallo-hydrolase [Opitutaceae bacterium]
MLPLEDNSGDVISKAMRGHNLGDTGLARRAGVTPEAVQLARKDKGDEATLRAIAPCLRLHADALVALRRGAWQPRPVAFPDGFAMATTPFGDMTVNAYLVWDPSSRRAALFDTGASAQPLLAEIEKRHLGLEAIFLTHTHRDHIADLPAVLRHHQVPVWTSEREPLAGSRTFADGSVHELGALRVRALSTWGHSPGGASYVIDGLAHPLAVVGDSLFASSMGGGMESYEAAWKNNVEKLLRLPPATVLACGHGPLTTVGEELAHNPFFAS